MSDYDDLIESLMKMDEDGVRHKFIQGVWAERRKYWVSAWLRDREAERKGEREKKDLAQSSRANAVAEDTLQESKKARCIAIGQ